MHFRHTKRVVLGMSGGVDSSVSASLLQRAGYDVVGVFFRIWTPPSFSKDNEGGCCSLDAARDARRVAEGLGIPFYVVNAREPFKQFVVDALVDDYLSGRTPNPCINCNKLVRFELLLQKAALFGAAYIATGHYARVVKRGVLFSLERAVDAGKDQSYFLHGLGQRELSRTLFPLGALKKSQVRTIAKRLKLPVATKAESQDLCFVGRMGYREFLREYLRQLPRQGSIVTVDGQTVGTHRGLPFYTIGQRRGLGVGGGKPYYVVSKDEANDTLIVTDNPAHVALNHRTVEVSQARWVAGSAPSRGTFEAAIRYQHVPQRAQFEPTGRHSFRVQFCSPQRAVTPGQSLVLFAGRRVLGGGTIAQVQP